MKDLADQLDKLILDVTKGAAIALHERIVRRTPIDTGRAKSSWNLSEGAPDLDTTPALATRLNPITGAVIELGTLGASPLNAGQAEAAASAQTQNLTGNAPVIFISNNLDYIEKLENGSSQQAPAGMVRVTVIPDAVQDIINAQVTANHP